MKWKDHRRIVRDVCSALNVSEEIIKALSYAVITPDERPDYHYYYRKGRLRKRRVSHHSEEAIEKAWEYIKKARENYLKGFNPAYELGRALHYIQDYTVDPTKKLWIFSMRDWKKHEEIEQSLRNYEIPSEVILKGAKLRKPNEFKARLFSARKYKKPEKALEEAVFLTASAISVVFNPEREGRSLPKALMFHLMFLLTPLIIFILLNPYFLTFGILLSFILHKLDAPFHKANLERIWFRKYR